MRNIGIALMLLGLGGFLLSGVTISRPREVARIGSVRVTVQEDRRPLVPRQLGMGVFLGGVVVLIIASRRRSARDQDAALPRGSVAATDRLAQHPNRAEHGVEVRPR